MMNIKNFSFNKNQRLLKRKDFLSLQTGCVIKLKGNFFLILTKKNSLNINRVGIIVKKKIGNAVIRNYYKRLVREFFRTNNKNWKQGFDFIFIAQTNKKNNLKVLKSEEFLNLDTLIKQKL